MENMSGPAAENHKQFSLKNGYTPMQKIVKCDTALLKLLQHSNREEIDFLVSVLTDNGAGRLALSSSIRDFLLHQKAEKTYTEDGLRNLLHELQEYGGHSIMNLLRDEPVPYVELLTDVHKKLNGKDSKTKSSLQKEREIVLSLFGENWKTMDARERWDRCTGIQVVSGFFEIDKNLSFNTEGIAFGLSATASAAVFVALRMLPPAAIATASWFAVQSVSEAYRITIPFIVQIARIKMLTAKA
jgi:uncharacterized protein YaaW (UPF0174 family)